MRWTEIVSHFRAVREAPAGSAASREAWTRFAAAVQESSLAPPYHLKLLMERLDSFRGSRAPADITVLDHGCGGTLSLFYLAALGYRDFWGVDVGGDFATLNAVARREFGIDETRLHVFDGGVLPIDSGRVDFIFSQQVIEHVEDRVLNLYYAEEGRVLRPGGWAVHYVPHRLVPYDSHTRTWFAHYLPQPLYRAVTRTMGRPVPDHLHLRWPWRHRALAARYIGTVRDVTADRLARPPDADRYDGSIRLRHLLGHLASIPGISRLTRPAIANLVMLETIAVKSGQPALTQPSLPAQ